MVFNIFKPMNAGPPVSLKNRCLLSSQNGSALIICLLSLAVLSALGTAALLVSVTNQTIAGNFRRQSQAFFAAEAGLHRAIAEIRNDITWRGETTGSTSEGNMEIGDVSSGYTVTTHDARDDGKGLYDPLIPGGYVKLTSEGVFLDTVQTVEIFVRFSPVDASRADSPQKAVVTSGENTGSGGHVVDGYDQDGNEDTGSMVKTLTALPVVNQNALKIFADVSFTTLENDRVDADLSGQNSFWRNPPQNTRPYIIHVSGDMNISGNRHVYGIFFVEGDVTLGDSARIHGVIYAPNALSATVINGITGYRSVMGQVLAGPGGVHASGDHADVQYVKEYVDAFNNFGGDMVNVKPVPGTWRQY
ncbi:MAG: PilX N-terminal domain-containing pilus assembly protein [Desulfotignum sp.]|nr:PilX N-terminal domain-containing pilus assembly protein [Desulfotignum sp.]